MIMEWLVYGLVVSLLVSVAAWLAEGGAKAQRWPTRWVWLGAMAVSIGLPVGAWLIPSSTPSAPSAVAAPATYVLESIPAIDLGAAPEAGLAPTTLALIAWGALSVLLLAVIAVLATRLHLRRRRWRRRTVEGVDVWVSRQTGPAALGLLRGHVVVPDWVLSLDPARRRMLVAHEAEHVRARDPQLALAGLVLCALVPWNLPLWWQLRRLRLAIEVDCDGRVLRRAGDARGYGSLLLEVCQRRSHLAVALAESKSMLERRIRMIAMTTTAPTTLRALGLAAVAGLVLAVACETPGPTSPADAGQNMLVLDDVRTSFVDESCPRAVFVNGARSSPGVVDAMDPANVKSVHVFSTEDLGEPPEGAASCSVVAVLTDDATVEEEDAARRLVERLATARLAAAELPPPAPRTAEDLEAGPTFTPMTVRPQLRNQQTIVQALEDYYPPLLRDAGIGGTTNVWFFIDVEGAVQKVLVNQSSGYEAMDEAAQAVARLMEFTPAYNREQRVPVWFALDITFEVRR